MPTENWIIVEENEIAAAFRWAARKFGVITHIEKWPPSIGKAYCRAINMIVVRFMIRTRIERRHAD